MNILQYTCLLSHSWKTVAVAVMALPTMIQWISLLMPCCAVVCTWKSICENITYLCNYIMHRNFLKKNTEDFFSVFHLFLFSVLKEGKASFCLWFYSIILTLAISSDFWLFHPSNKHAHRVNELYMNLKPFKVMIPIFTLSFVRSNSVTILRYFILPPIVSIWLFKEI